MIFNQERMMVSYLKTISFPKPESSPDTTEGRPQQIFRDPEDFPCWKAGSRDFKAQWGLVSGLKVSSGCGSKKIQPSVLPDCRKISLGMTGFEESSWRPSLTSTLMLAFFEGLLGLTKCQRMLQLSTSNSQKTTMDVTWSIFVVQPVHEWPRYQGKAATRPKLCK